MALVSVNAYLSCIGVVFATVWAGGAQQQAEGRWHQHSDTVSTAFRTGAGTADFGRTRDSGRTELDTRMTTMSTYADADGTWKGDSHVLDVIALAERKESRDGHETSAQVASDGEALRVRILPSRSTRN
jgi:hypothetical protein